MIPLRDKFGSVFDWLPTTVRFRFLRQNLESLLCVPLQEPFCLIRVFEITIHKRQTRAIGGFESSATEVVSKPAFAAFVSSISAMSVIWNVRGFLSLHVAGTLTRSAIAEITTVTVLIAILRKTPLGPEKFPSTDQLLKSASTLKTCADEKTGAFRPRPHDRPAPNLLLLHRHFLLHDRFRRSRLLPAANQRQ
jgi:hypothetical protein